MEDKKDFQGAGSMFNVLHNITWKILLFQSSKSQNADKTPLGPHFFTVSNYLYAWGGIPSNTSTKTTHQKRADAEVDGRFQLSFHKAHIKQICAFPKKERTCHSPQYAFGKQVIFHKNWMTYVELPCVYLFSELINIFKFLKFLIQ